MKNDIEYSRKWREEHKEKAKEYNLKYYRNHPWAKHMARMRERCNCHPNYNGKKYIRKVYITMKELKDIWFRDKAYLLKRPSIDRIDNDGNYTVENCRFIEHRENCRLGGYLTYKKRATNLKGIIKEKKI